MQTRYKITTEKKLVRKKKKRKPVWVNVRRKIPYTVLVRDERMYPEKAIPAAAQYLARLENRYGGRDWAVFAYHCGEGCAGEVRAIAQRSDGLGEKSSVAKVFFGATPATQPRVVPGASVSHGPRLLADIFLPHQPSGGVVEALQGGAAGVQEALLRISQPGGPCVARSAPAVGLAASGRS